MVIRNRTAVGAIVWALLMVTSVATVGGAAPGAGAPGITVSSTDQSTTSQLSATAGATAITQSSSTVFISGSVAFNNSDPANGWKVMADGGGNHYATFMSGGNFSLEVAPNTTYNLKYEQFNGTGSESWPIDGRPDIYALDEVAVGSTNESVGQYQLPRAYLVNVTVVNQSGGPIENADVFVRQTANGAHSSNDAITNVDGEAGWVGGDHVGLELRGDVEIHVEGPPGYGRNFTELTVSGNRSLTLTLPPTVNVSGQINESDGAAAVNDTLRFKGVDGTEDFNAVVTNATGQYGLELVDGGVYHVEYHQDDRMRTSDLAYPNDGSPDVFAIDEITAVSGGTVSDTLPAAYDLNVTVVNESGDPVSGAQIRVGHSNNDAFAGAFFESDAQGRLNDPESDGPGIEVVGDITVDVEPPSGTDYAENGTQITVTGDRHVTIVLKQTVAVTGHVRYANGSDAPFDGIRLDQIDVPQDGRNKTDANGNFTVRAVEDGKFYVQFHQMDSSDEFRPTFPRDGFPDLYAIEVVETGTADLDLGDITIPNASILNVTVVDENGTPIEGAGVNIQHRNDNGARAFSFGDTNADGMLVTGETVGVEVTGEIDLHAEPPTGANLVGTFERVQVGGDTNVTLVLQPAVNVSGQLFEADGDPAAGDVISWRGHEGTDHHESVPTNATGEFSTKLVENGTYDVEYVQNPPWRDPAVAYPKDGTVDILAIGRITYDTDVTGVSRTLPKGHNLTVTVEDEQGNPVSDARVHVSHHKDVPGTEDDTHAGTAAPTNVSGVMVHPDSDGPGFEVNGTVHVHVEPPAGSQLSENGTTIDVTGERHLTLTLHPVANVTGQISYANSDPAADWRVAIDGEDVRSFDDNITDANGSFSTQVRVNGTYNVHFTQIHPDRANYPKDGRTDIQLIDILEVGTADIDLGTRTLDKAHLVNVTVVTESGTPVTSADVHVEHVVPALEDGVGEEASLNGDGEVVLWGASEPGIEMNGTLQVGVHPDDPNLVGNHTRFTIDQRRNVTVVLHSAVNVSGQFFEADGDPAADDQISWHGREGTEHFQNAVTDSQGRFATKVLENGTYDVEYEQNPPWVDAPVAYPKDGTVDIWAIGRFTYTSDVTGVEQTLPVGHNLTVTVVNESGFPVEDARVHVTHHQDLSGTDDAAHAHVSALTNAAGDLVHPDSNGPGFEVNGTVHIGVDPPHPRLAPNHTTVDVGSDRAITVVLQETVNLTGHLQYSDGNAVQGWRVYTQGIEGTDADPFDRTKPTGKFTTLVPENGTFSVEYAQRNETRSIEFPKDGRPDLQVIQRAEVGTSDLDLGTITLRRAHLVNVTVERPDGTPVTDAEVTIGQVDRERDIGVFEPATVDSQGEVWMRNADAAGVEVNGTLFVEVRPNSPNLLGTRQDFEIGSRRNVTLVVKPAINVSGQLWEADGDPAAEDVLFWNGREGTDDFRNAITDSQGRFFARVVENGTYEIEYEQNPHWNDPAVAYPKDGSVDVYAFGRFSSGTDVTGVNETLPVGHNLTVTVVNESGFPVKDARVNINHHVDVPGTENDAHAHVNGPTNASGDLVHPDSNGPGFEVNGTVHVHVEPPGGSGLVDNGTTVEVTADRHLTIVLHEPVPIRGRINYSDATPASQTTVHFHGRNGTHDGRQDITNATGHFEVGALANSTYNIHYHQDDFTNDSDVAFPTDGNPDIYGFTQVFTGTDGVDTGTLKLPDAYQVQIAVVNETGAPVPNATVRVFHNPPHGLEGGPDANLRPHGAPTNANGLLEVPDSDGPGLDLVGDIGVFVIPPDGSLLGRNGTEFNVSGPRNVTVVLKEKVEIRGQFLESDGDVAADDNLALFSDGPLGGRNKFTKTNATGHYSVFLAQDTTHDLQYYQANFTGPSEVSDDSFPRDDSPDMVAVTRLNTSGVSGTIDLGSIQFPRAYTLNISVVDSSGMPVENAGVGVQHRNADDPSDAGLVRIPTNENGLMQLNVSDDPSLDPPPGIEVFGEVRVEVRPPPNGRFFRQPERRTVNVSSDTVITVTLRDAVNITGTLLEADGSPTSADTLIATVSGEPAPEGFLAGNRTSPHGRFSLSVPENQSYDLAVGQINETANHLGERDGTVDFFAVTRRNDSTDVGLGNVTLPAGHVVNVSVVNESGAPVADAEIDITHVNTSSGAVLQTSNHPTNADGKLVAKAFEPFDLDRSDVPGLELRGNVTLDVRPPGDAGYVDRTYTRELDVTGPMEVTVSLEEARPVSGRLFEHTGAPATGDFVIATQNFTNGSREYFKIEDTNSEGNFTIEVPRNEPTSLGFGQRNESGAFMPRDGVVDLYEFDEVNISSATDLGNVTLPEGHVVNVTVEDELGDPVENATVHVIHESQPKVDAVVFNIGTNSDGMLQIEQRPPGIELSGNVRIEVDPPADDSRFFDRTATRNLTVTSDTNVTVTLDSPDVTGRVLEPNGSAAANDTVVTFGSESADSYFEINFTAPSGRFEVHPTQAEDVDIAFYQGTLENDSHAFAPIDGVVDMYAVAQVNTTGGDVDLGDVTLPGGHMVNVTVVDESGDPVENASISLDHYNGPITPQPDAGPADAGLTAISTNANGRMTIADHVGIELVGNVTVTVNPPENETRFIDRTYRRNLTVTNDTGITVQLVELPRVSVSSEQTAVNATTNVSVTLSKTPAGLSGYIVNVTLSNATVANITGASYPSSFDLTETRISGANSSIRLKATDLGNNTVAGDTDVLLAKVSIEGTTVGESALNVSIERLDDDNGSVINATTGAGTFAVQACSPLASDLPPPTDPDDDGDFEDTNGNGRFDFDDIVTLFEELESAEPSCEDFNHNGRMDFDDIVTLFEEI